MKSLDEESEAVPRRRSKIKSLEEESEDMPRSKRSKPPASTPSMLTVALTLASVVVSGVVGMSSAYLTANASFATIAVKVERNERDIAAVANEVKKTSDSIPRLEGKVDALLVLMKDK